MSYTEFEMDVKAAMQKIGLLQAPKPATTYVVPRIKLDEVTREIMKAESISYGAAFAKAQQAHPTLAAAYADELGRRA